jgi:N-acetylglucosaminyl-diphospho-decaprenol L-rhamnosyltransferase
MNMDLSVICVNWNSADYLRDCIDSIYENTVGVSFEIVVVDNASPEGRLETLQARFPDISITRSERNLGFAGANNVGFQQSSGDYVLFLNPDTKLLGPAITTMLGFMKGHPSVGIVGGKLLNSDLSVSTTSIQRFPTILNQLLNVESLRLRWPTFPLWDLGPLFSRSSRPVRVEVIPGACMLLRRAVFEEAGMFSEDYFMYAEDLDLNHKINRLGLANYYVGDAVILHYGGKSSSRQTVSQWATIMKHRAMVRLFTKTHGRIYGSMYQAAMGASAVARLFLLAILFPFGDRRTVRSALEKWSVVLKWALGLCRIALHDR